MTSKLKKVSKLIITFLVDNNIEWMTKLPPGFSHEILHHIRHSPLDEEKGCLVLDFNQLCCGAHGFAALLETELAGEQEVKNTAELEKQWPPLIPGAVERVFSEAREAQTWSFAGDSVYISGEIPRVTEFEAGLLSGVRWVEEDGKGKWAAVREA
ncbi:hypothetical protein FA15DRAFT_698777 [Coprinopsis marcescibilis]|uniref:Uncharacterized protein n=1 Tax=Coprinopsis marcescibilis TaxID=230819 RepID=A0A5C3K9V3_COPMA|nr:hypothetical protein FA15DRAFT_698777 [Coprinopsis marcescibilis]